MKTQRILFLVSFFFISFSALAQTKTSYRVETFGSLATGENTPFWMTNHNWGVVSLDANNFYARGSVFHEQKLNKDWSFDAGIDLLGANSSNYGNFWIQQLFGRINWKIWRLDIGSREDYISLLNPFLSSGDFIHSNHARPIPQVKLSFPQFVLVPYTKGNMYIKGHFSLGYYLDSNYLEDSARPNNQNYVKNLLSHTKSLYFRFGDIETKNKMQFTFGFQHAAQWGGDLYKYQYAYGQGKYNHIDQPQGLDDLFRVAIAKEGSQSSSGADQVYVAGSNWGAYIFKYDYRLKNDDRVSLYIDHFFEDGSSMAFENYPDNLYGVEFSTTRRSLLSGVVLEYIYTKHQGGSVGNTLGLFDKNAHELFRKGNGNDNYYNNVDYASGPSHFGKTLGTPLFLSPEYNAGGNINFEGSRIKAWHLGLEGYVRPELQYRLLLTTGQNWGRYYIPFTEVRKGFASQLEVIYNCPKIEDWMVKLSLGYDNGRFFGGNTFGGGITLSKTGIICAK
jgi:hypothetical protein